MYYLVIVNKTLVCGNELFLFDWRVSEQAGPSFQILSSESANQGRLVLAEAQIQAEHVILHLAGQTLQAKVKKRSCGCTRSEPIINEVLIKSCWRLATVSQVIPIFIGQFGQEGVEVRAQILITHTLDNVLHRFCALQITELQRVSGKRSTHHKKQCHTMLRTLLSSPQINSSKGSRSLCTCAAPPT